MPVEEGQPTSVAYYYDIDLAKNQLLNAKLHPVQTAEKVAMSSTLNSNDEGLTVYDIQKDTFYVWNGNTWLQVGLTEQDLDWLVEAYRRSVMGIDITQTTTDRTITLTYRDNTAIADLYKFAHIHTQSTPALTWNITHNLGKFPAVSVVDSADQEVIGEVEYINDSSLNVKFSAAFSGKAYIN